MQLLIKSFKSHREENGWQDASDVMMPAIAVAMTIPATVYVMIRYGRVVKMRRYEARIDSFGNATAAQYSCSIA